MEDQRQDSGVVEAVCFEKSDCVDSCLEEIFEASSSAHLYTSESC